MVKNEEIFRRTQEQHLDFIALLHAILLELVLDLLVPGLALLLLRAHSATHLGDLLKTKRTILRNVSLTEKKREGIEDVRF